MTQNLVYGNYKMTIYPICKKQKYVMNLLFILYLLVLCLLLPDNLHADTNHNEDAYRMYVDLPVVETFNQQQAYSTFSMQQSLALTKDYYYLTHYVIDNKLTLSNKTWEKFVTFAIDMIPLADIWLHEEWHRAVLQRRGYSSKNNWFGFSGTATNVTDDGLISLKLNHPAEQVRLSSAGIEAEYELISNLQKEQFFYQTDSWNTAIYWAHYFTTTGYIAGSISDSSTTDGTQSLYDNEGSSIEKRDAIGFDPTAWVYDLFRRDEPYSQRGLHPSGNGIDRYIVFSELGSEEKQYLKKQLHFSLINFLDPHLIGFREFGSSIRWMLTPRHMMTSFGYTLDLNLYTKSTNYKVATTLHRYQNHANSFLGIDFTLYDNPITARLAIWNQPEEQRFKTSESTLGGLFSLRYRYPVTNNINTYVELESKTQGWVAGNPYLNAQTSFRIGFLYL